FMVYHRDFDDSLIRCLGDDLDVDIPTALFQLDQCRVDRLVHRAAAPFSGAHRNSPLPSFLTYLLGLLGLTPLPGGPFGPPLGPFLGGGGSAPFPSEPPDTIRLNR